MTPRPWTNKLFAAPLLAAVDAVVLADDEALEPVAAAPEAEPDIDEDVMVEFMVEFVGTAAVVPVLDAEEAQVAAEGRFEAAEPQIPLAN